MKILSAIEIPADAAKRIEAMGTDAVTVLSEVALGTYPGIRPKIRSNAVALVGQLENPHAVETMSFLVNDPNPDVSIRAMRAAGRLKIVAKHHVITTKEALDMEANGLTTYLPNTEGEEDNTHSFHRIIQGSKTQSGSNQYSTIRGAFEQTT